MTSDVPSSENFDEDVVRSLLAEVLPGGAGTVTRLELDSSLRLAGLDSMRTIELLSALEDSFAIRFEEDDLRDEYFLNVAGLIALVIAKRTAGG